jgi:uncharacterized membrane protein YciS (DUF1049 family)
LVYLKFSKKLFFSHFQHTTNAAQPTPPNANMRAVMHFFPSRVLCHDDIRAIRMVYELPIKRDNADYDDTCRRDFPMNKLQKLMYKISRILTFLFIISLIISIITCVLTLIYLLIRYLWKKESNQFRKQTSTITTNSWVIKDRKPMIKTKRSVKPHGYLWHDEMI